MGKKKHYKKLYLIYWVDSHMPTISTWSGIKGIEEPENAICISVGWIHKETKRSVIIIPHISGINWDKSERSGVGYITIPTSSILERVNLIPKE